MTGRGDWDDRVGKDSGADKKGSVAVGVSTALAASACVVTAVVTATVGQQSYYLGSVLVILFLMAPVVVGYETSRPSARDVALLAVLCALAVASRAAFFWLPYFKPMAAVVMVTGIALGPRSGFLAGALAVLVSNFLFGQGPWTPWQMLAFGLAGFAFGGLATLGIVPKERLAVKSRVALAAGGALFVMLVLGPVLDTSSVFLFLSQMTPEGVLAIYAAGLPVNAVHALATALTLFFIANPVLNRVGRLRRKFGVAAG